MKRCIQDQHGRIHVVRSVPSKTQQHILPTCDYHFLKSDFAIDKKDISQSNFWHRSTYVPEVVESYLYDTTASAQFTFLPANDRKRVQYLGNNGWLQMKILTSDDQLQAHQEQQCD
jgi:hypothetical protein